MTSVVVPRTNRARAIAWACGGVVALAAVLQLVDLESPWAAMGGLYLSSAAIGVDAVVVGVRKRVGEGPSIRNLAPGGWAIFAAMFWIVAVPAYYLGQRRARFRSMRSMRSMEGAPEPVTWGSWVAIGACALLGAALFAVAWLGP